MNTFGRKLRIITLCMLVIYTAACFTTIILEGRNYTADTLKEGIFMYMALMAIYVFSMVLTYLEKTFEIKKIR